MNTEQLERIVQSIPGAIYQVSKRVDGKYVFTYLSAQAGELFDIDVAAALEDPSVLHSKMDPSDLRQHQSLKAISARDLSPFQFVARYTVRGAQRWIASQSLPARDEQGRITWTGQFVDYTREKEREQAEYRAQKLLKAAQEQAQLGCWDFELATGKITWTQEVYQIHGVDPAEGEPNFEKLGTLYHPEDFKILAAAVQNAITTGEGYRFDLRILKVDTGEVRHVDATGGVLLNPLSGQVEFLFGTLVDITERKKIESELSAARDAAESAAKAKSNFLASMSHELRTPLNGIVGMTSLLGALELTERQREYCTTIQQSAEALVSVVNDILDWSHIESGKIEMEQIAVDLPLLQRSVLDILQTQAAGKALALELNIEASDFPLLSGDPGRLRQILLNLVANAIKFTETGSVQLKTRLLRENANQKKFRIEVIDSGIGITPQQITRLFQRFSQADASTTRKFGGTGLGLAISKSLVELMGGEIGVTSVVGSGSTFWLELSLPLFAGEVVAKAAPQKQEPLAQRRAARILIAEDNIVNQRLATIILEQQGHQPEIACDGLIALNKAVAQHYDLILMDCQMPEMDGYEATRRIRAQLPHRVPIVGLTASALLLDRENCIAAGMDDYLSKPYRAEQLLAVVDRWCKV
jgi:signal transduction histidine kinase/CheY-like chemotaxis protein